MDRGLHKRCDCALVIINFENGRRSPSPSADAQVSDDGHEEADDRDPEPRGEGDRAVRDGRLDRRSCRGLAWEERVRDQGCGEAEDEEDQAHKDDPEREFAGPCRVAGRTGRGR